MAYAARPPILKTADFPRIAPNDFVIAVAEKRRVKVDQVYAFTLHRLHNVKIVAENEFVYGHVFYAPLKKLYHARRYFT